MPDPAEQFIGTLPAPLFWIGREGRCQGVFVFKGDRKVSLKLTQDQTCEDCMHNEPSCNGWCDLHSRNTFKLGLSTCGRCNNLDKPEFRDACADYKTKPAAADDMM